LVGQSRLPTLVESPQQYLLGAVELAYLHVPFGFGLHGVAWQMLCGSGHSCHAGEP
jgi:hypothetical protein